MNVRIRRVDLFIDACQTRIPFRFGMTTMEEAPLLTARVEVEVNGVPRAGFAADLLVPKWFDKNPATSVSKDRAALIDSARSAAASWCALETEGGVFEQWWHVYQERVHRIPETSPDRLVRGFGVALIERAVIDATCRGAGLSFFEALRVDLFGVHAQQVHPELTNWSASEAVTRKLPRHVHVRHTVGLADPLRDSEVEESDADGLPRSLEQNVSAYGLEFFKVKVAGDPAADLERLSTIARILSDSCPDPHWTADGNEQFEDPADLARTLDALARDAVGARFVEKLLYVEQPVPRAATFEPGRQQGLAALTERAPVIIDEADHGVEAFPRALELGYRGVSVKNCKGVFRALLTRGICDVRGEGTFQSAEDLTNLGVLPLQQDLATVAALGLRHVERNGHHYFRGLDHLPLAEARAAYESHPTLYAPLDGGGVCLRIEAGCLDLSSLDVPGFGYDIDFHVRTRTPVADWDGAERLR